MPASPPRPVQRAPYEGNGERPRRQPQHAVAGERLGPVGGRGWSYLPAGQPRRGLRPGSQPRLVDGKRALDPTGGSASESASTTAPAIARIVPSPAVTKMATAAVSSSTVRPCFSAASPSTAANRIDHGGEAPCDLVAPSLVAPSLVAPSLVAPSLVGARSRRRAISSSRDLVVGRTRRRTNSSPLPHDFVAPPHDLVAPTISFWATRTGTPPSSPPALPTRPLPA